MNVLRTRHPGVLALLAGGAIAVLLPSSAAIALQSNPQTFSVSVGSGATLLARGAAVEVPVLYSCPAGGQAFLDLTVSQRAGSRVTTGTSSTQLSCTGTEQTTRVTVAATAGGRSFKHGAAVAQAGLFACGGAYVCGTVRDAREITIRR